MEIALLWSCVCVPPPSVCVPTVFIIHSTQKHHEVSSMYVWCVCCRHGGEGNDDDDMHGPGRVPQCATLSDASFVLPVSSMLVLACEGLSACLHVCLSARLTACAYACWCCLSVCLPACLPVCLNACLSDCLTV